MSASFDVIVVGGGAVGAACARELAAAGRSVLLLERGVGRGEAWGAAAGMLAPQIECVPEDPLFDLGLAGRERYAFLAEELRATTGIDIGLWQGGIAQLALEEGDAAKLRSHVALQRQHGHLSDWLDAAEVRERWPWAGPCLGALWAPRDGAVDPKALVEALRADAVRRGAVIEQDEIVSVEQADGHVTGVRGKRLHAAGDVILAAGAWSGRIDGLPRPLSIEPVRGQMAAVAWPKGAAPGILYNGSSYLLHRTGEAIVGSTMEYAGERAVPTPEGLAQLRAALRHLMPGEGETPFVRTWAGLRPMSPDGLPIVGAEPKLEGLWYATGHGRNGILLAGITGVILRELLDGDASREELGAIRADRFWQW